MSGNKKEKKVAIIKSTKQIKEITIVTNDVQNNIFTRELLLEDLRWLGLDFDLEKNANFDMSSDYFYIQSSDSKIKIIVCETDEMKEMAKITLKIM